MSDSTYMATYDGTISRQAPDRQAERVEVGIPPKNVVGCGLQKRPRATGIAGGRPDLTRRSDMSQATASLWTAADIARLSAKLGARTRKDGPVPSHRPELGACWVWDGRRLSTGYSLIGGVKGADGKWRNVSGHRFAYEMACGPIPPGLQIDHLCRNTSCVNPDHLEAVTPRENTRRGTSPTSINAAKTHCIRGHPLTEDNVYRERKGRRCRICQRESNRASERRKREASK